MNVEPKELLLSICSLCSLSLLSLSALSLCSLSCFLSLLSFSHLRLFPPSVYSRNVNTFENPNRQGPRVVHVLAWNLKDLHNFKHPMHI